MESQVPAGVPAAEAAEPKRVRVRKPRASQQVAEVPLEVPAAEAAPAKPPKRVRMRTPWAEHEAKTEVAGSPPLPVVDAPFFAALGGTLRSLQRDDRQAKLSSLRFA